jgi:hypothetical protein
VAPWRWSAWTVLLALGTLGVGLGSAAPAAAAAKPTKHAQHVGATTTKRKKPASPAAPAVRLWLNAHEIVFTSLQTDLDNVTAASNNGSVKAITSGCDQLAADVATMIGLPPIPESKVQRHWAAALADFKQAADDCVQGLTQNDSRVSDQYTPEIHAAIAEVDRVISELKKLR